MTKYEAVIGLEIHAEMMTASKMFCGCRVVDSVEAEPNTAVCPVCLGMPGMLPVINKQAIELAMRVGLALNCEIQPYNVFARKNYFYPDLAKSYQISQYEEPIAVNGWLDIDLEDGERKRIRVRRVHMEEDTGKLTHVAEGGERHSLVDYNRAGVPLLEIVSEPDMRSVEEARAYATKIRQIVRYLAVNTGDMEKGVIRFESNVSVRPRGSDEFGTRTEVKNLNSFRALVGATAYELVRQAEVIDGGGKIEQDTLGWDESKEVTFSQRSKEDAHDYRYFPEPDLPPLQIEASWIEAVGASLPELPEAKMARYEAEYGLGAYEAGVLTEERPVAEWFEAAVAAGGEPKQVANWVLNHLFSLMNEAKLGIEEIKVGPAQLVGLIGLVEKKTINSNTGKDVLAAMFATGAEAAEIVEKKGLAQISDTDALAAMVAQVLADNPDNVARYLEGQTKLQGWFVGQVMKASRGKANPGVVNQLLAAQLAELANS
ncbi:MAG TPA: Asp-tRNA(Asn)/Glu-tRNA(Gln) amidotransferase subunit GatB [Anaerolineae bacterium]|nr:Asp-tRNA(Asn)/Glu-tRNA(Gln) amidotransferase subunit GatB [Anaerolineae bacterium]